MTLLTMASAGPTATAAPLDAVADVEASTAETSNNDDRNNHPQQLEIAAQPPFAQRSPPSSSLHPVSSRTATTTFTTTSTNNTLIENGRANQTAAAFALHCRSPKPTISLHRNSFYRIAALSLLILSVVFGAGFGLGVLYAKNHSCRCSGNEKATTGSEPLENTTTTTHCNHGNVRDDDASGSGSSSGGYTIPPVDDASSKYLPPVYIDPNAMTCIDSADALDELRMAVTSFAQRYINQFAYYIRMGGNSSSTFEGEDDNIEWDGLDYAGAMTIPVPATATTMGGTTNANANTNANATASQATQRTSASTPTSNLRPNRKRSRYSRIEKPTPDRTRSQPPLLSQHNRLARSQPASRRRRMQSAASIPQQADSNGSNSSNTRQTAVVEEADTVQTNHRGDLVYVSHGDEIVILQSATTAVQSRLRVPTRHYDSFICGMLLLTVPQEVNDETDLDEKEDTAAATDDEVLVVLVQEYDFGTITVDSSDSSVTNTTVLVYYPNNDSESSDAFMLVQRYSLPGSYDRAFAVPNGEPNRHAVHVLTSNNLYLHDLTEYLTPAFLQTNSTAWYSSDAPKLVLNESQYRELAYAQLERSVDGIVQDLAAGVYDDGGQTNGQALDCTGFVALSRLRSKDTNLGLIEPSTLVHISSFDFSTISSAPPHATTHKGTMSMLPPGSSSTSYWNMLVSDTRLVLACDVVSGQTFTVESVPLTWIVAFDLVNATVQPTPSSGLVYGMIVYELELDCFQANGKDYIRLITTRADNLTDYQMYDEDTPFPSVHTVLQILQASGNDNDSDTNGGIMPVVGELTLFRGQGLAVASVYRQDFVMVVVGMVDTLGFWHPTTHTVFTIDTFNPTNPHVMEELFLPVKSLELYSLDDTWIVGISSYHTTDEHPFPQPLQLVLWNASDRHGATQAPYLWIDDTVLLTNGTGINSTISQVVSNMADDYSVAAALRYIKESNVLVMPVYTERYKIRPCPSYDWMYEGPQSSSHNQRLFNDTCRYDQVTVFDGFWILKIDLAPATTTSASNAERSDNGIRNITKHFAINHASTDLLRRGCVGSYSTVPTRSLAFNGDVMTMKRNAILSHDLLTKVEADPVIFFSTDCN